MAERPFKADAIDEIIHGRLRLGVVAYLVSVRSATFSELREAVGATDGNLSTHLKKLEDAGYVAVDKSFNGRKPQTRLALTETGRGAWRGWLNQMQALQVAAAAGG